VANDLKWTGIDRRVNNDLVKILKTLNSDTEANNKKLDKIVDYHEEVLKPLLNKLDKTVFGEYGKDGLILEFERQKNDVEDVQVSLKEHKDSHKWWAIFIAGLCGTITSITWFFVRILSGLIR